MDKLLIRGGTVVTAQGCTLADVLVEGETITAVDPSLPARDDLSEVDASGLLVLPGGIDPHVHMELPVGDGIVSADDFASGSTAALAGGTTTLIDFVTPGRDEPLADAHRARRERAEASRCDVALHGTVTTWRPGMDLEMEEVVTREGTTSFKIYFAYLDTIGIEDGVALRVMEAAGRLGCTVLAHCENGRVVSFLQHRLLKDGVTGPEGHPLSRPAEAEEEAVRRAVLLAHTAGCRLYVVHVSTEGAVRALAEAQASGVPVHGEACPHHLLLDEALYRRAGFDAATYVLSPPLRRREHREALWAGLEDGTLEVVSTDHCSFTATDKERGRGDFTRIPNGGAGVEHRLALLFTHGVTEKRFGLERFVELVAEAPAKRFGLWPAKGRIQPGADADIVLWDPEKASTISAATHHHNTDLSLYEGFHTVGRPRAVYLRGRLAFDGRRVRSPRGAGRVLKGASVAR